MQRSDKNGDKILEKDKGEWEDLSSTTRSSDANLDGKITVDEVMAKFGALLRSAGKRRKFCFDNRLRSAGCRDIERRCNISRRPQVLPRQDTYRAAPRRHSQLVYPQR